MAGDAKTELTYSTVDMKFPSATWREILAAKMDKSIMWLWAFFWLLLLLLYFAPTIACIMGNCNQVLLTAKMVNSENLITKFEAKLDNLTCLGEKILAQQQLKKQQPRKLQSENITTHFEVKHNEEGLARKPEYVMNKKLRVTLPDWLVEVHHKFELRQETLYLTLSIVDQFLSMKTVPKKELRLVGIASMLIACRYEEIWAPEVNDFLQISEETYEREQVLAMEKAILGTLLCYWTVPTPYMFLSSYVKASVPVDYEAEKMVYFFAELGMMNYFYTIKYPSSLLAASSVYAARSTLNNSMSWTKALKQFPGYSEDQLKEYARLLVSLYTSAPDYRPSIKHSKPEVGLVFPSKALIS